MTTEPLDDQDKDALIEKLLASNERLSKMVIAGSNRLEASRRDLMAHGWNKCAEKVETDMGDLAPAYAASVKLDNPYKKPLEVPGT